MSYAGVQMFMQKLNHLIKDDSNGIPFFNNPEIICERPQFQWLYDELASIIQTLFIHQYQHLQQLNDLKQRFIHAAEEAEYFVDLFLSDVHSRNNGYFDMHEDFKQSIKSVVSCVQIRDNVPDSPTLGIKFDDVRRSLESVQVEFMNLNIDSMKMLDSSPRPQTTLNQSAVAAAAQCSTSRNSPGSNKLLDGINLFVGIDLDAVRIIDKLVEDKKKLDVVSIVCMGGIGKTTLATEVFNDGFVRYHFHVRVWVTVSQTYDKRAVLVQILESIRGQLDLRKANDPRLRELVHKNLMGKRYLIVIDDIWDRETWDSLKVFFPHDNNGSRILLTSRHTEVAKHANSDGLIHHLGCLNKETGWELLCRKVFQGNECPEWSIKPGMQIVENCHGLPLALVVIAGVLAKDAWSKKFWEEIAKTTGSYIIGDKNGCMETLGLSYNHLPLHLRECFLYLGGFPEDYKIKVRGLIWLWVAEGFIQQDGNRSFEDIAEGYLMDLIDRNLVIVADKRKSNGGVKACKVHDLIRELCLRKAKEEKFILKIERPCILSSQFSDVISPPYNSVRMFINDNFINSEFALPPLQNLRSILCFGSGSDVILLLDALILSICSSELPKGDATTKYFHSFERPNKGDVIAKHFCSFVLLRVLNLQKLKLNDFPKGMELLVHLRYLAICKVTQGFPDSICKLWNLQTLIYYSNWRPVDLPSSISDLVNLRHLLTNGYFVLPSIERAMKSLQTISTVKKLGDGVDNFQKCLPYIKKLRCFIYSNNQNDFKSLTYLEKLKITSCYRRLKHITFPLTLKSLELGGCLLPWSKMSHIQLLPNLQVLKLKYDAFKGSCWNTNEQEFSQLKFLRLNWLNIKLWKVNSRSFPCLRQLQIELCKHLEEIPLEIGDIPTLELVQIRDCRPSVYESARRIEEEQRDSGNYSLEIDIFDMNDIQELLERNRLVVQEELKSNMMSETTTF